MKLRLNRRPDTVRNVVLNPRNEKLAFREKSRKSISYLKRGDEKKDKSRRGGRKTGDKSDKSKKNGPRRHSGEQTIKIVKRRAHQFQGLSRGHETRGPLKIALRLLSNTQHGYAFAAIQAS